MIESRKRPPSTTATASQTERAEECGESELVAERHRRELQRCREEYSNTLEVMEESHHQALTAANSRHREDIERLQEKHHQILGMCRCYCFVWNYLVRQNFALQTKAHVCKILKTKYSLMWDPIVNKNCFHVRECTSFASKVQLVRN